VSENPVHLTRDEKCDRPNGLQFFSVHAKHPHDGHLVKVGVTYLRFFQDQKNLVHPHLDPRVRNLGLGLALYVAAERTSDSDGHNPTLTADTQFMSDDAGWVWQSLVRRGLAIGVRHYSDPYRFLRTGEITTS
jgi:hypothetical protein